EDKHDAEHFAGCVPDGGGRVVDRSLGSIARDQDRVVAQANHDALAQHPLDRVLDCPPGLLVEDVKHYFKLLALRVGRGPAGQFLGDGVQKGDSAVSVSGNDRIPDAAQRYPQPLQLLLHLLARAPPMENDGGLIGANAQEQAVLFSWEVGPAGSGNEKAAVIADAKPGDGNAQGTAAKWILNCGSGDDLIGIEKWSQRRPHLFDVRGCSPLTAADFDVLTRRARDACVDEIKR